MRPVSLVCGARYVHSYWIFYGLGLLVAACVGIGLARCRRLPLWKVGLVCVTAAVCAVVFGRLGGFCFRGTLAGFFRWQSGGQVSFSAMVGALLAVVVTARGLRLSLGTVSDGVACVFPMAQGIQRIGCFLHGCCYGPVSDSLLAVRFVKRLNADGEIVGTPCFVHHMHLGLVDSSASHSLPVLPTQLLALAVCLFVSGVCLWMFLRRRWEGRLLWLYFALYGALRFILQFFRPNYDQDYALGGWNSGHLFSAALCLMGMGLLTASHRDRSIGRSSECKNLNDVIGRSS